LFERDSLDDNKVEMIAMAYRLEIMAGGAGQRADVGLPSWYGSLKRQVGQM
jgi:hypothetical protein